MKRSFDQIEQGEAKKEFRPFWILDLNDDVFLKILSEDYLPCSRVARSIFGRVCNATNDLVYRLGDRGVPALVHECEPISLTLAPTLNSAYRIGALNEWSVADTTIYNIRKLN